MVMGAVPPLVLMAFAPMEMQGLGTRPFDPLFSTADVPRLVPGSGMVSLNVLILIASLRPGVSVVGLGWLIHNCRHHDSGNKSRKNILHDGGVGLTIHFAFPNEKESDNFSWICDRMHLDVNLLLLLYSL